MLIIKRNGGFAHSKRAKLNVTNATYNTEVMALQNGTELVTTDKKVTFYEIITAGADGALTTTFTAIVPTGSKAGDEIAYIYEVDPSNGTYSKSFKQVDGIETPVDATTFTYTSSSKAITFGEGAFPDNTSETSKPKEGTMFAVCYQYESVNEVQTITMTGDSVPATVLATAYGLAKDTCTGELFPCQVDGMAQIDGNWNFDLAADGEPVVQNLSMEFVRGCLDKKLYDFKVYTDEKTELDSIEG